MIYLLDTCIVSEVSKQAPNPEVIIWLNKQSISDLFVSTLTLGEIEKGISKLPESSKKHVLDAWFRNDFLKQFEQRILPIDANVALKWGFLSGSLEAVGKKLPVIDGLIAATALTHNAILVTRNENDFQTTGVALMNPWAT